MDCLSPTSPVERVVFIKGAQVGATESANCWMGYVIHHFVEAELRHGNVDPALRVREGRAGLEQCHGIATNLPTQPYLVLQMRRHATLAERLELGFHLLLGEFGQGYAALPANKAMMLPHLATRLYNRPLLIQRAKLDAILSVLGDRVGWTAMDAQVPTPAQRVQAEGVLDIAVIPVYGSLVRRSLAIDPASGLTSYTDIGRQLDQALADLMVQGMVLDVDSPGGEAGGAFELGERIRAASAVKPVWAVAADSAFSAAYAIACGASRLLVSRTGSVGSIGVIALHVDQSHRDAQYGYRFTAIDAGERKKRLLTARSLE